MCMIEEEGENKLKSLSSNRMYCMHVKQGQKEFFFTWLTFTNQLFHSIGVG